jgi:hypothetical protein
MSEQRKKLCLLLFSIRNKTAIYPLLFFHLQDRTYPLAGLINLINLIKQMPQSLASRVGCVREERRDDRHRH